MSFASPLVNKMGSGFDVYAGPKLREGKELEDALAAVDPREHIDLLDTIRDSNKRSREFITYMAKFAPIIFQKYAKEYLNGEDEWFEIDDFLRRGQKIHAIKLYREKHGAGLKDSKYAVEQRAMDLKL